MYLHQVYLNFSDPEAAYKAAMSKASICEEYPDAKDIGDILYEHWGIMANPEHPNTYDEFEDYGERSDMDEIGEDLLMAIAPYVDMHSRVIASEASDNFGYSAEVVTFNHKKAHWTYPYSFENLIMNSSDFSEALATTCHSLISVFPKSTKNIQNEADIETFLEKIKGTLRTELSGILYKEMDANRADIIPPTNLTFKLDGIVHGKEITEFLFYEDKEPNIFITYTDPFGMKQQLEYEDISLRIAPEKADYCEITMKNIKKGTENNHHIITLPLASWRHEICNIESIEFHPAGLSQLSVYDFKFIAPDNSSYLPKTKIAGKEFRLKAGYYERAKEKSQNFSR